MKAADYLARLRPNRSPSPAAGPSRARELLKSLPVVVILTVLIWIYAERAQIGPDQVSVLVSVGTSEPNLVATVIDPVDTPLTLALSGPRGQLEAFKTKLMSALQDRRLKLMLSGADAAVGSHALDAARLLNADPLLSRSGVFVTGTTPTQIRVTVDPMDTVTADIVLPRDLPVTLLKSRFEPAHVTLHGPRPAIEAAFPNGKPTVVVNATRISAGDGSEQTLDLQLVPPADPRLTLDTSQVKMTFTAGSTVQTSTIPSAFIDVVRPVAIDGGSKVIIHGGSVLHNVQIRGPAVLVNKYTGGRPESDLRAMVFIKPDDVGKTNLRKELKWPVLEDGAVQVVGGPSEVDVDVKAQSTDGAN